MKAIIEDHQTLLEKVYEFQQKYLPVTEWTLHKGVATGKFIGFVKNKKGVKMLRYLSE
jgi:hypothetical protein